MLQVDEILTSSKGKLLDANVTSILLQICQPHSDDKNYHHHYARVFVLLSWNWVIMRASARVTHKEHKHLRRMVMSGRNC